MAMQNLLIGVSDHIDDLRQKISAAPKDGKTILIEGPTGTGKQLVAEELHDGSNKTFIRINCSNMLGELIDSELFGHKRGSFTGAGSDRAGKIKSASGGTLFIDEIGDIGPATQAKLIQFLDDRTYYPVGSDTLEEAKDVKVVSATNKDLNMMVQEGKFREDLYHRICGYRIRTEPLNTRPEDVVCLVNHFDKKNVDTRAKFILYSHRLPGNVRELKNLVDLPYKKIREDLLESPSTETQVLAREHMKYIRKKGAEHVEFWSHYYTLPDEERRIADRMCNAFLKMMDYNNWISCFDFIDRNQKDILKYVRFYEIMTLRANTSLPIGEIARYLGIRKSSLTRVSFRKDFGIDLPAERKPWLIYKPPRSLLETDIIHKLTVYRAYNDMMNYLNEHEINFCSR
jgi:DNA-binding NtrC family response regulator